MTRAGADGFIIAGEFSGTIEFGPSPGALTLTATGVKDVFVARIDTAGRYLWARRLGGTGLTQIAAYQGAVPDDSGSYYVAGSFVGTTDFDPGPGVHGETSQGTIDAFVVKIDGNGDLIWAQRFGSPGGNLTVNNLAANAGTAVLVGGCGGGVVIGGSTLCASPGLNGFAIKVDGGTGNLVWPHWVCDAGCTSRTVVVEDDGAVVLTGGSQFASVQKYDSSGTARGSGSTGIGATLAMARDSQGALYVAGEYGNHAKVVKLSQTPHPFYGWVFNPIWAWTLPDSGTSLATSLRIDGDSIYAAGRFSGSAEMEGWLLTSHGMTDAFAIKLDLATGGPQQVETFGGSNTDEPFAIELDEIRNLYTAGVFKATADFDPGPAVYNLTSTGGSDGFVWKFGMATLDVEGTDPSLIRFAPDDPGLSFDLVKGLLSQLTSSGSYAQAACMGTFTVNPAIDTDLPPPGDGFYYLARGQSCCAWQAYGDSTILPDPHDELDLGPCP